MRNQDGTTASQEDKVSLNLRLPRSLHEALEEIARERADALHRRPSLAAEIRLACAKHVESHHQEAA